jgi:hypothetical protein
VRTFEKHTHVDMFHQDIWTILFSFDNEYLRGEKLRFGIVQNHSEIRFELWLMGQNKEIQNRYWDVLKASKWNEGRAKKPQYAELEAVIEAEYI